MGMGGRHDGPLPRRVYHAAALYAIRTAFANAPLVAALAQLRLRPLPDICL